MDKQALIESARELIGVPFVHEGRSLSGLDCYGLLIVLGTRHGIPVPIERGYGLRPSARHMRLRLEQYARRVPLAEIALADILHIKFANEPQHLALVSLVSPLMIIHADAVVGRVVEHRIDAEWRSKIRGVYRVPA